MLHQGKGYRTLGFSLITWINAAHMQFAHFDSRLCGQIVSVSVRIKIERGGGKINTVPSGPFVLYW